MKRSILGAAFVAALVLVAVAGAAPTVVASPGVSPFSIGGSQPCGDKDMAAEQIGQGSTLYPDSEIEPRSTRFESTIVGEYQQDRWDDGGARGLVASVSHENGSAGSWHRVVIPGITACSGGEYLRASDPWVSFGPTGDLYAISLSFFGNPDPNHNAILVSKSTDLGEHWSNPPTVLTEDTTNGLDKESITADPTNSDYVYAAWDRIVGPGGSTHASDQGLIHARSYKSQTFFTRSTNAGDSWEKPQQIFVDSAFSGSIGSIVQVGSGTTLLDGLLTYGNAAWKGGPCGSVSVLRSPDRGVTWEKKPVIVSPYSCTYVGAHDPDTGFLIRSGGLVDFATRGSNAYMVWEDALPSEPRRGHIFFSQSTDDGVTWSTPIVISHTPPQPGVDAFVPTIEINSAGKLGVSYYDFRNNTSTTDGFAATDLWLTQCTSNCASQAGWSVETQVTPQSFDMSAAPVARGQFLGDYMGMTTNGTTFQPFYIQSGTPPVLTGPTDAFFSTVP